jgi:cytochrome c553
VEPSRPETLDQPWRRWASIAIIGALGFSILFGFLILPVVQGQQAGIDPFTAICRALGLTPGSPAMSQPPSSGVAEPTTEVAWSTELLRSLATPGPAGKEIADTICVACHGEDGISLDPVNPNLAGQSAVAIYKQLHDYQSGSRFNELMTPIAESLTEPEIVAVSAHFASLAPRMLAATTGGVPDEDIVALVERGDPARALPACNACHSPTAGGPLETPNLARQNRDYLAAQLTAYRAGERRNDIYTRMRSIAAQLTDREIERLAAYYSVTLEQ